MCQQKASDEHKKRPREKSFALSSFFCLPFGSHPVCWLRWPVPSAGHPMKAHLLTQITFVPPPPCHYKVGNGAVSWFDTCIVLPW